MQTLLLEVLRKWQNKWESQNTVIRKSIELGSQSHMKVFSLHQMCQTKLLCTVLTLIYPGDSEELIFSECASGGSEYAYISSMYSVLLHHWHCLTTPRHVWIFCQFGNYNCRSDVGFSGDFSLILDVKCAKTAQRCPGRIALISGSTGTSTRAPRTFLPPPVARSWPHADTLVDTAHTPQHVFTAARTRQYVGNKTRRLLFVSTCDRWLNIRETMRWLINPADRQGWFLDAFAKQASTAGPRGKTQHILCRVQQRKWLVNTFLRTRAIDSGIQHNENYD